MNEKQITSVNSREPVVSHVVKADLVLRGGIPDPDWNGWIKTEGVGSASSYWPEVDLVLNGNWRDAYRSKWDTWANSWLWKLDHAGK